MTYNVMRYGLDDRDGDGQKNDPKPADEVAAIVTIIAAEKPDVLAVQEIGSPLYFEELRRKLRQAGLDYTHADYVPGPVPDTGNLAVYSRFPIVSKQPITNEVYAIGAQRLPVLRGFLSVDIEPEPGCRFRLMTAHLKSKVFDPNGQTEMRRNEARLLAKHIRNAIASDKQLNLLVAGDLGDTVDSSAVREILASGVTDLRPADPMGDVWSRYVKAQDAYERVDYLLASPAMLRRCIAAKSRTVRHPLLHDASDHRPLVAVFAAK